MEIQNDNNQVLALYPSMMYTGNESKLLMNSKKSPSKRSNIDKQTNNHIYFLFITSIKIALGYTAFLKAQKPDGQNHNFIDIACTAVSNFLLNFLNFSILYYNLRRISLQGTLDFVKILQAYFVNWDQEICHSALEVSSLTWTSNLDEDLGQIKYIFSDKTETLTQIKMQYVEATISGNVYAINQDSNDEYILILANGDGANDAGMIPKTHFGVGNNRNEGLQAANGYDFTIAQFRLLQRLLFVHGAWFYARNAKVMVYSFYKKNCLWLIELWFTFYSNWTVQELFEGWLIGE